MAISKRKVSEMPRVNNIKDFHVFGTDKNTNSSAFADMEQLQGNTAFAEWAEKNPGKTYADWIAILQKPAKDAAEGVEKIKTDLSAFEKAAKEKEAARVQAETLRGTAEGGRVDAEKKRVAAESVRFGNEDARIVAEQLRKTAETKREEQEATRERQEKAREEATVAAVLDAEAATENANKAATEINEVVDEAKELNANQPKAEDGTWWFYDTVTKEYVDSGLTSEGSEGHAPIVLSNGNFANWDRELQKYVDTGVKSGANLDIRVGVVNLIVRHNELKEMIVGMAGQPAKFASSSLMLDFIPVFPGEFLCFSKKKGDGGDSYFRYAYYEGDKETVVFRKANGLDLLVEKVPAGSAWLRVSYSSDDTVQLTRGNTPADFSLSPEDQQAETKELIQNEIYSERNLLLNSGRIVKHSGYTFASYPLSEKIQEGEQVTITIKGKIGEGKYGYFWTYNSGENTKIGNTHKISEDIHSLTAEWKIGHNGNRSLDIYVPPQAIVAESEIEWAMLTRGSKVATKFIPAPEDAINELREEIPSKISDLPNNSKFQTLTEVAAAIAKAITEHNGSGEAHADIRQLIVDYLTTAKGYTDEKIKALVGAAPEALDTIYELAAAISEHKDIVDALNSAIDSKLGKNDTAYNSDRLGGQLASYYAKASDITELLTYVAFMTKTQTIASLTNISVNVARVYEYSLTANATLSLRALPKSGYDQIIKIKNTSTAERTVTLPSSATYENEFGTALKIGAGKIAEVNFLALGSKCSIRVGEAV